MKKNLRALALPVLAACLALGGFTTFLLATGAAPLITGGEYGQARNFARLADSLALVHKNLGVPYDRWTYSATTVAAGESLVVDLTGYTSVAGWWVQLADAQALVYGFKDGTTTGTTSDTLRANQILAMHADVDTVIVDCPTTTQVLFQAEGWD